MPPRPNPFGRPPIRGRGAGGAPRGRPAMPRFVPPNPDQMRQEKEEKEQAQQQRQSKEQTEKPVKQAPQVKHSPFGGPPPEVPVDQPMEAVVTEQPKDAGQPEAAQANSHVHGVPPESTPQEQSQPEQTLKQPEPELPQAPKQEQQELPVQASQEVLQGEQPVTKSEMPIVPEQIQKEEVMQQQSQPKMPPAMPPVMPTPVEQKPAEEPKKEVPVEALPQIKASSQPESVFEAPATEAPVEKKPEPPVVQAEPSALEQEPVKPQEPTTPDVPSFVPPETSQATDAPAKTEPASDNQDQPKDTPAEPAPVFRPPAPMRGGFRGAPRGGPRGRGGPGRGAPRPVMGRPATKPDLPFQKPPSAMAEEAAKKKQQFEKERQSRRPVIKPQAVQKNPFENAQPSPQPTEELKQEEPTPTIESKIEEPMAEVKPETSPLEAKNEATPTTDDLPQAPKEEVKPEPIKEEQPPSALSPPPLQDSSTIPQLATDSALAPSEPKVPASTEPIVQAAAPEQPRVVDASPSDQAPPVQQQIDLPLSQPPPTAADAPKEDLQVQQPPQSEPTTLLAAASGDAPTTESIPTPVEDSKPEEVKVSVEASAPQIQASLDCTEQVQEPKLKKKKKKKKKIGPSPADQHEEAPVAQALSKAKEELGSGSGATGESSSAKKPLGKLTQANLNTLKSDGVDKADIETESVYVPEEKKTAPPSNILKSKSQSQSQMGGGQEAEKLRHLQEALISQKDANAELTRKVMDLESEKAIFNQKEGFLMEENAMLREVVRKLKKEAKAFTESNSTVSFQMSAKEQTFSRQLKDKEDTIAQLNSEIESLKRERDIFKSSHQRAVKDSQAQRELLERAIRNQSSFLNNFQPSSDSLQELNSASNQQEIHQRNLQRQQRDDIGGPGSLDERSEGADLDNQVPGEQHQQFEDEREADGRGEAAPDNSSTNQEESGFPKDQVPTGTGMRTDVQWNFESAQQDEATGGESHVHASVLEEEKIPDSESRQNSHQQSMAHEPPFEQYYPQEYKRKQNEQFRERCQPVQQPFQLSHQPGEQNNSQDTADRLTLGASGASGVGGSGSGLSGRFPRQPKANNGQSSGPATGYQTNNQDQKESGGMDLNQMAQKAEADQLEGRVSNGASGGPESKVEASPLSNREESKVAEPKDGNSPNPGSESSDEDDQEITDDGMPGGEQYSQDDSRDSQENSQDSQDRGSAEHSTGGREGRNLSQRVPEAGSSGNQGIYADRQGLAGGENYNKQVQPGAIPGNMMGKNMKQTGSSAGGTSSSAVSGRHAGTHHYNQGHHVHGGMPHQIQQNSQQPQYGTGSSGASGVRNNVRPARGINQTQAIQQHQPMSVGNQNRVNSRRGHRQQNQQPSSGSNGADNARLTQGSQHNRQGRQGGGGGSSSITSSGQRNSQEISAVSRGTGAAPNNFVSRDSNDDQASSNNQMSGQDQRGRNKVSFRGRQQRNNQQQQTSQGQNAVESSQKMSTQQSCAQQERLQPAPPASISQERREFAQQQQQQQQQNSAQSSVHGAVAGSGSGTGTAGPTRLNSRTHTDSQKAQHRAVQQVISTNQQNYPSLMNAPMSTHQLNRLPNLLQNNQQRGVEHSAAYQGAAHSNQSSQQIPASRASDSGQFGQSAADYRAPFNNNQSDWRQSHHAERANQFESGSTSFMMASRFMDSSEPPNHQANKGNLQQNQGQTGRSHPTTKTAPSLPRPGAGGVPFTQISQVSSPPSNSVEQTTSNQQKTNEQDQRQSSLYDSQTINLQGHRMNQQNEGSSSQQFPGNRAPDFNITGPGAVGAPPSMNKFQVAGGPSQGTQTAGEEPSRASSGGRGGSSHVGNNQNRLPSVPENSKHGSGSTIEEQQVQQEWPMEHPQQQQQSLISPSSMFAPNQSLQAESDPPQVSEQEYPGQRRQAAPAMNVNYRVSDSTHNQQNEAGFGGSGDPQEGSASFNQQQQVDSVRWLPEGQPRRTNDSRKTSGANTPNKDGANTPTTHQSFNLQSRQEVFGSAVTAGLNQHLEHQPQIGGGVSGGGNQQNYVHNLTSSELFSRPQQETSNNQANRGASIIEHLASAAARTSNRNESAFASLPDDLLPNFTGEANLDQAAESGNNHSQADDSKC